MLAEKHGIAHRESQAGNHESNNARKPETQSPCVRGAAPWPKGSFRSLKGLLSAAKRTPFAPQKDSFDTGAWTVAGTGLDFFALHPCQTDAELHSSRKSSNGQTERFLFNEQP